MSKREKQFLEYVAKNDKTNAMRLAKAFANEAKMNSERAPMRTVNAAAEND